jgi:hypothetical protein
VARVQEVISQHKPTPAGQPYRAVREATIADLNAWTGDPIVILPTIGEPTLEIVRTDHVAEAQRQVDEGRRTYDATMAANMASRDADADAETTRHTMLLKYLDQAIEALPEIGDLIGQPSWCGNLATSLATAQKSLLTVMAREYETPAPAVAVPAAPVAAPATELPADLVAHGWTLEQRRGKWYASVAVESEEAPIETIGRNNLSAAIADAVFMDKNLRIGAVV